MSFDPVAYAAMQAALNTLDGEKMDVFVAAPATAASAGTAGQMAYDSGNIYICVATDTWKKVAVESWGA